MLFFLGRTWTLQDIPLLVRELSAHPAEYSCAKQSVGVAVLHEVRDTSVIPEEPEVVSSGDSQWLKRVQPGSFLA